MARPKQLKELAPATGTVELAQELAAHVDKELGIKGFTPLKELALIAANPLNDIGDRLKANIELARYYRPQVRAMAISTHATSDINITISDLETHPSQ